MNATFFGLAFLSALNPKLLGVDLLLMNTRRRDLMFVCFLLGGMGVALTVGLLDVLVLHANAIKTQGSVSAGLDVALGVPLLIIGALVATGRLHSRRRAPAQAGYGQAPKKDDWEQRILRKPRYWLIVLIGAVCGLPGGLYLAALHTLVTGKSSTATQVVAVVIFVLLEFSLVIIPFVFLVIRPEGTRAQTKRAENWLMSHARELIAVVILFVGAYMVINGLVRLIG
jgi:Sap, sulfolipid-1-addressing protein